MRTIDLKDMCYRMGEEATDPFEKTAKVKLPYSRQPGQNFNVFWMGDEHVGNSGISEHSVAEFISAVKRKKNSFIINMGDNLESINVKDKRYSVDVHGSKGSRLQAQRDGYIKLFDSIGDKFLTVMDGNHEMKFQNDFQPNKDIADKFNSVYVNGTMAKIIFPEFRVCAWHGSGTIRSRSGDELQRKTNEAIGLKRKLRNLPAHDCEIIACGHFHKLILHEPTDKLTVMTDRDKLELAARYSEPGRIYFDKEKDLYRIPEDDKWYICTGSFLRGYMEGISSYVEEFGMGVTELGWVEMEVKNGKPYKIELKKLI